ncbi:hypothetical protein RS399_11145 [Bacillus inaquosorum]|uniref:hypothetical protein n=1 Tax=Bacillus inaquosorum TaxID=483913 RepID=UPI001FE3EF83|nr:hypothetical protein [Bacillus inaquosorum]WNW22334.1 hypothetical protein RS399_11145 [Bacillus inaquosorum]
MLECEGEVIGAFITDAVNNDPQKAIALKSGEGLLTFVSQDSKEWSATLSFGEGMDMDLAEFIEDKGVVDRLLLHGTGVGRDNTDNAGWVYEYRGLVLSKWPAGIKSSCNCW